jgi:RNA polymerase sigma-70 factor (ECF subfamily)
MVTAGTPGLPPSPTTDRRRPRTVPHLERDIRELAGPRGALHRYVRALVAPDVQRAEDIVQEALLRAWLHGDRLDTRDRPIRPWLFRIARNLVIDDWRRDRLVPVGVDAEAIAGHDRAGRTDEPDPVDVAEVVSSRLIVADALRRLSAPRREVLVRIHLLGYSTNEVARTLGIPAGTVKSRSHHAGRALRQELYSHAPGPQRP